jgi:UDP-N-acetylglucosamine 2-epimerase (non-hydrolysing)
VTGGILEGQVAVVLGTRPEIIKLAGVIRGLGDRARIVHTGQRVDDEPPGAVVTSDGFREPDVRLEGIGGVPRARQVASVVDQLTQRFSADPPAAVVVQGDTNSAAAGAIAAHLAGVPVVHVEAGLRSFDRSMPEEINRQLVGVVADLHCAPTPLALYQLRREGVADHRIVLTGNTSVEATLGSVPDADAAAALATGLGLEPDRYVLVTLDHPENVDHPDRLRSVLEALAALPLPAVLPVHSRTRGAIDAAGLGSLLDRLRPTPPLDHPTFLGLARHARLLVSDSGGVQEECTILKRPLVVLRTSTERPETIDAGFAVRLVPGPDLRDGLAAALADDGWPARIADLPSPFGDGTASRKIVAAIQERFLP